MVIAIYNMSDEVINYDEEFLKHFYIISNIKEYKENEKRYTILLDKDYKYQNLIINKNIYVVHSLLEIYDILFFFHQNIDLLGD